MLIDNELLKFRNMNLHTRSAREHIEYKIVT